MSSIGELDVSQPTFDENGIHFLLNDPRPNKALWVSVDLKNDLQKKNLLGWINLSETMPGPISVRFQDCKYMDGGVDLVKSAKECEVFIGAQLANDERVVSVFSIPISEMPKALIDAANKS
jgi:hypothetical protein